MYAADALFWSCASAVELNRADEALACLARVRRLHPKSQRVSASYCLEASLLRTAKSDCRGALEAHDAYLEHPDEHEAQARHWRDWCERQVAKP